MTDLDRSMNGGDEARQGALNETLRLFDHDIRAALSDMIGGLRLIDEARLDAETRTQLERVRAAGETLAELVDAALMAASGETLLTLDDSGADLGALVTAVEMRWAGQARERGIGFRQVRGEGLPERIGVSRMALDRILANLIGNAIRHTDRGEVVLDVSLAENGALHFEVADQGTGFTSTALAKLWSGEPVPRDGAGRPGSGLGLRIAKDLADRMGGSLSAGNRARGGASVTLTLPRAVWAEAPGAGAAALPDLSALRVLVAEDNLTNQMIVRNLLNRMGTDPVIVNDGVEALEALETAPFDIALVDIEMPRMSGIELMRKVRARDDAVGAMPIVALTAYVLRDNREAIYSAGADGIIGKPIRSGAAFGRAILRHAGHLDALPEAQLLDRPDQVDLGEKLNTARLDDLLQAAGPDGSGELLDRLAEDLASADAALSAAVTASDLREVRGQTHILVSLAGAVGAERLQRLAEAMNLAAQRGRAADLPGLYRTAHADLEDLLTLIAGRRAAYPGA